MQTMIGIRREDKNRWERRVPLIPKHVREFTAKGLHFIIQPSPIRIFPETEYAQAGAVVQEDLTPCSTVFAVKEIPIELLQPGKTYVFFSHVMKGQEHNMPMLRRLMDLGCSLIDYERIVDATAKRLIFFGTHAGYAGMVDTLHALGQRLEVEGHASPLSAIQMAHAYASLAEAKEAIRRAGAEIEAKGLPPEISPLIFGITGYGHVSTGAQGVLQSLPVEELRPRDLLDPGLHASLSNRKAYKVVFREEHMVEPVNGRVFELKDYYANPQAYRGIFHRYLPRLSVVLNCIYWDHRYPRPVRREDLRSLFGGAEQPALRVIGDLSCDIEGGVECTVKVTDPESPTFVYLPKEDRIVDGFRGHGPVVMAIDNLPCEISREASEFFSEALVPYTESIARADMFRSLEETRLPEEIRRAVIVHRGALAPDYKYLEEHLRGKEISR